MRYRTKATTLTAVALVTGGVVAGTAATTFAWFSATGKGTDSRVSAATVALGRGGGSVALAYKDLKPGEPRVTQLTISYQGSVPADVTLEITPSSSPSLCVQHDRQWKSPRGGAVTVAIGSGAPVSYCDLLNGRILPLVSAMRPRSEQTIDIAVMLSPDANETLRGLAEKDVATVWAKGGFTDHAEGTISIATAGLEKHDKNQDDAPGKDVPPVVLDPARKLDPPPIPAAPGTLPLAPIAGPPSGRAAMVLPAECAQAGMRLESFEDVIVLGPDQHTWKAPEQRGLGAGPFLIVGTGGDDEIVGSEGADCIIGGEGKDLLTGGAGNDVLIGGAGDDRLDGGLGDDWLFGGPGADELRGGGGIDRFDGGPGDAVCDAGRDAAAVIHCRAPAPPASSATGSSKQEPHAAEIATPTTTSPPPPSSPPATPSSPTPTTAAPASASSTPPATPPAQASSPTTAKPTDGAANTSAPSEPDAPQTASFRRQPERYRAPPC